MLSGRLSFVMSVEIIKADSFHAQRSSVDLEGMELSLSKHFHNLIASLRFLN